MSKKQIQHDLNLGRAVTLAAAFIANGDFV